VELRSFRGSGIKDGDFVAPTIRIAPGRTLTIDLENNLERCTEEQLKAHRCSNETNLHTHGLWVSPSGNSDNVLISIPPGERFRYQYRISEDHPAGTFWYHPHRHGSGFVQVGSGMAGALIVTGSRKPTGNSPGDVDILLKDEKGRPLPERVMLFQQIQYGCLDEKGKIEGRMEKDEYVRPWTCAPGRVGRIESDDNDWDWMWSGRFTGINGKVQPALEHVRTGAFERWRLIHAGTREPIRMRLYRLSEGAPDLRAVRGADQEQWMKSHCQGEPLPMWHIAGDGLTRSAVRRTSEAVLFAGDRMDVLAHFPSPGRYCMVQQVTPDARGLNASRALAIVEAKGRAAAELSPDVKLQALLNRSAERELPGPAMAAVRGKVLADLRNGMRLDAFVWHKPISTAEVSGYREATLNVVEPVDNPAGVSFHINGRPYDHQRIDHVLPLGAAEEWHVASVNVDHPLHIHVNPFQIIRVHDVQGRDVTDPNGPGFDPDYAGLLNEWKDTVFVKQGYRIALRTRYERFTGDFVTHCHIMFHGDHGMMLNLRIADPAEAQAAHKSH
jgi:FtsP/CotA-like multicopper oxidase with cupredoxin domain